MTQWRAPHLIMRESAAKTAPVRDAESTPTRLATVAIGCYRVLMDQLYRRAIIQGILETILSVAFIFWPAGTFHYWQGWLFLAVSKDNCIRDIHCVFCADCVARARPPLWLVAGTAKRNGRRRRADRTFISLHLLGYQGQSASPRCLDGGDVDFLHRHHCLEGTFCLGATSRKRLG